MIYHTIYGPRENRECGAPANSLYYKELDDRPIRAAHIAGLARILHVYRYE
jgi:hypothetical protein